MSKKRANVRGSKGKMSAKARRRHERGMQMAEAVLERTSLKLEKSLGRGKNVQDRAKAWELINKRAAEEEQKAQEEGRKDGWETDEEADAPEEGKDSESMADAVDDQLAGAEYIPIDDDQDVS